LGEGREVSEILKKLILRNCLKKDINLMRRKAGKNEFN